MSVGKKTRFEVFKRDNFTCQYCGKSAPEVVLEVDHIQPVIKGGNDDLMNLVTSCFDCNRGKRDRELSDSSVLIKRKQQLDQLQERREQLEMMVEWQKTLVDLDKQEVEVTVDFINSLLQGRRLNECGIEKIKKSIKRFGLQEVFESARISAAEYLVFDEETGRHTELSSTKFIDYIPKIAMSRKRTSEKPYLPDLYYIRGILRNRMYCKDWEALKILEEAYLAGNEIELLKSIATNSKNWTEWKSNMETLHKEFQESEDSND